jgi:hypothetical protein
VGAAPRGSAGDDPAQVLRHAPKDLLKERAEPPKHLESFLT